MRMSPSGKLPACLRSIIFLTVISVFTLIGCRKTEFQSSEIPNEKSATEKFFTAHQSTNPAIITAQQFVKNQNDKFHFVYNLVKKIGLPHWDKSLFFSKDNHNASIVTDSNGDPSTVVYIPFVVEGNNDVKTSLFIKMTISDTSFGFLYNWKYSQYPYGNSNGVNPTAEEYALLFMKMDESIFGSKSFMITDSLLFRHNTPTSFTSTKKVVRFKEDVNTYTTNIWKSGVLNIEIVNNHCTMEPGFCSEWLCDGCTVCRTIYQVQYYATWWEDDPFPNGNGNGNGSGGGSNNGGGNWNPQELCVDDPNTFEDECSTAWVPDPPPPPTPAANQSIIDSLFGYPCAQAILAQTPSCNSEVARILDSIFNVNETVNLLYKADTTLTRDSLINGYSITQFTGLTGHDQAVFLNEWMIKNSTTEYIATTILHEGIHAYIDYWFDRYRFGQIDSNQFKQMFPIFWNYRRPLSAQELGHHNEMANNYVGVLSRFVKQFSPGLNDSMATALAWKGLAQTTAWHNRSDTNQLKRLQDIGRRDTDSTSYTRYNMSKCN